MSLFHFHVTQIKRSAGQSAVACAAYRAGEKLKSEYYGEVSDYTRKGGVVESGIMLPEYVPQNLSDRETLWNEVEKIEKGKKAQLAYSFDFALQNEFTMEENISLAKKFIREQFVERGTIADFAIHSPETNGIANPHVHVLCPIRPIDKNGEWGNKQKRVYELDRNGNRITDHMFERVQERMAKNKRAPARKKAEDEYLLTTKLFCGTCGRIMAGESGTSGTGKVKHYYYKCGGAKRHLGCKRKAIKKDWIERVVVLQTVTRVLKDEEIERIANALLKMQEQEDTTIPAMQAQLKECEKAIENMLNAIQSGILTESTKGRLEQLEEQQRNLKTAILRAEIRRPKYSKERIVNWISRFKGGNPNNRNYQRQIIDTFVNSVYVYDDKLVFTYNFKDGTETITLKEIEAAFGSDLNQSAPPFRVFITDLSDEHSIFLCFFIVFDYVSSRF